MKVKVMATKKLASGFRVRLEFKTDELYEKFHDSIGEEMEFPLVDTSPKKSLVEYISQINKIPDGPD